MKNGRRMNEKIKELAEQCEVWYSDIAHGADLFSYKIGKHFGVK
jgi:hypothetical protein